MLYKQGGCVRVGVCVAMLLQETGAVYVLVYMKQCFTSKGGCVHVGGSVAILYKKGGCVRVGVSVAM